MSTPPLPAIDVPVLTRKSLYPQPFAAMVEGRLRHRLGDHFGLTRFGINLAELPPGGVSAMLHHHTLQDEFIYVLAGTPTLVLDEREYLLRPGDCCGFKAGSGVGHQLLNRSQVPALYLEVGDRTDGDVPIFPRDDLKCEQVASGTWIFTHKDGSPY